jgi:argininosuccinate lyase
LDILEMKVMRKIAVLVASMFLWSNYAWAANTGELPCKTTAECNAQAAKIGATTSASDKPKSAAGSGAAEDQFFWINKINRASAVMLTEEKILSADMGRKIAQGVQFTIDQANQPAGKRPGDVLQIEQIISDKIGPDASLIHTGRSRQDMYATFRMATLRTELLQFSDGLNGLRNRLLETASKNIDTVVPAYTNGVQAMPISYAHYLLAFNASFERDAQRIHELYQRLNRSAMGTAVLANSSWPLNRKRMAELLGFDGIIENAFDAGQIAPSDVSLEAGAIVSSTAIRIGMILNDIHTQYHQTRPWLLLDESATYTSSAMPQKRNPGLIMRAREAASDTVGLAQTVVFRNHNVTTGMTDYKSPWEELGLFPASMKMLKSTYQVLDALKIEPKRSLEELENDWTTSMELAEELQKEYKVPFRVGHSFASGIVTEARNAGYFPKTFPYANAKKIYAATIKKYGLQDANLPMPEEHFRQVLSPAFMVKTRVGTGGPQPAEVERMLSQARKTLVADQGWMKDARGRLSSANEKLDRAFNDLLGKAN